MKTDRQRDRQEVERQRRLCVSVVDRQAQDQLVVATEQTAAVDQSGLDPSELYYENSKVKLVLLYLPKFCRLINLIII